MPDPIDRGPGRLSGVRVRITLVATLATAAAVLAAGSWLTRTVERTLTDQIEDEAHHQLALVGQELQAGRTPDQVDLRSLDPGVGLWIIVDGRVVAATPNVVGSSSSLVLGPDGQTLEVRPSGADYGMVTDDLSLYQQQVSTSTGRRFDLLLASRLEPVRDGVDAVRDGMLATFPLLVAAVGLLTWFLSGRALRPVAAIRTEVEAISGSTLDRRVPVPSTGDEVARLAQTMNAMLDRLEDASNRQQRFVADASHELRSPVAAIRTELEVAQRTAGPDDWPRVAERLLGEEARLEAVIADLLLLASLDEGAGADSVVVDLTELAHEEARRRVPDRVDVRVEVDAATPVLVQGSRMQLRRVLANLLDNAGRHARSTVRVGVLERDGRARILVDDDGDGIDEADRERVFERFTRLDDHRTRASASGGAGLGLSLVRRIAERHGGTASVDTAPLGGARLVIDLPVHTA